MNFSGVALNQRLPWTAIFCSRRPYGGGRSSAPIISTEVEKSLTFFMNPDRGDVERFLDSARNDIGVATVELSMFDGRHETTSDVADRWGVSH